MRFYQVHLQLLHHCLCMQYKQNKRASKKDIKPKVSFALQDFSAVFFSSFERVVNIHCLHALDLGAGVELSIDCLIIHNNQVVQSIEKSMDWTLEENMINNLFFSATFTGCRRGHVPFVQVGAETCDTGVEADPRISWPTLLGRRPTPDTRFS